MPKWLFFLVLFSAVAPSRRKKIKVYAFAKALSLLVLLFIGGKAYSQDLAVLKYKGGGDWYSNPTAVPNLIKYCNQNINTAMNEKPETVEPGSVDIFQFPLLHMTGHGNVLFNSEDAENLRNYLESGGFIHIDDNYGMSEYLPKELKKIFPDQELQELPATHPVFSTAYKFPQGLPKIHEHDGKRPQALGLFFEERLVLLFTTESDLGDGWEDPEVHGDPESVRQQALQMGANIVKYAFEN
ncbi:DUF4159 domain-containing protein [Dokdonia sinensis]|uniref:DUF4159 domain-containing protein n=1 Tax=Dokdonia sinensis TaxID=2479847 RepID=A0A3M0GAS1_9FLAO|nr:DUF4159 domain-containing protein [Dokdonia sinensis]RMB59582.1 DUF4159 domain-containing protein [Dokdonia sinensis]